MPDASPKLIRCEALECQEPLLWVETVYGKRQPLDPAPSPEGNVVVVRHTYPDGTAKLISFALGKLDKEKRHGIERMGLHTRTSHHQTCVARERFKQ